MKLLHELTIMPGYDKRSDEPRKNYGVHGCTILFYVINPQRTRAVQFMAYTDWLPQHVQKESMGRDVERHDGKRMFPEVCQVVTGVQPMGADRGYHSATKRYSDQKPMKCDILKGGQCYYDGSGLAAEEVRDVMLEEGSDGVWRVLEEYYHQVFDKNNTGVGFGELINAFANAVEEASDEKPSE